jgi:SAM-dependent methyltransferase
MAHAEEARDLSTMRGETDNRSSGEKSVTISNVCRGGLAMTSARDQQEPDRNVILEDYIFGKEDDLSVRRFRALEAIFDPGTKRILTDLGVNAGWSCLDVGAGSGSIAAWLCNHVGPDGEVLATDLDTRYLERLPARNLQVQNHDVRCDPLPEGRFDLVHTRLVLMHLRDRRRIMASLISALKPGGWLLVEEFDALSLRSDPNINPAESTFATLRAMHRVIVDRGVELRCGRLLGGWLRGFGLRDIGSEGRMFMWRGGSIGADLTRANIEHLRDEILTSGLISKGQLEEDLAGLGREDFQFPSPILWAVWGRQAI